METTAAQAPGQSFTADPAALRAFIPGSVTTTIGYSAFEGIDVASLLQSLGRTPYGSAEQLASTTWPLLYFNDPILLGRVAADRSVPTRIRTAIQSLLDRQDAAGRFGLWRANDGQASVWLDTYILDFLQHAKEAGYSVEPGALRRGYNYLAQALDQIDSENADETLSEGPYETRAYAGYVLARAGRPDAPRLRRLHDGIADADPEAKTVSYWDSGNNADLAQPLSLGHLGGALSLIGDRARSHDSFARAIANLGVRHFPGWWWFWSYYSEVRDTAALLAVAAESGATADARTLRQHLAGLHPATPDLNSQEKAWILLAAHALNADEHARALTVNGVLQANVRLPTAFSPDPAEIQAGYSIVNSSDRTLWRSITLHGAPRAAQPAFQHGYTIAKRYYTLEGEPLDPAKLRQNDRLLVVLTGALTGQERRHSVIADPLPAAWEIESVIRDETAYSFLGPLSRPALEEARDDRFVAAIDLGPREDTLPDEAEAKPKLHANEFRLAYLVRVVTPGQFTLPEAVVEDMYRPGVMGRTDAGQTSDAAR